MICDIRGAMLSFLYLEHLKKEGLFDNLTQDTKKALKENVLKNIKKAHNTRNKYLDFRKTLNKSSVVNFISRDYINTIDYKEEFLEPKSLAVDKNSDFTASSLYDVKYNSKNYTLDVADKNYLGGAFEIQGDLKVRDGGLTAIYQNEYIIDRLLRDIKTVVDNSTDSSLSNTQMQEFETMKFLKYLGISDELLDKAETFNTEDNQLGKILRNVFVAYQILDDKKDELVEQLDKAVEKEASPLRINNKVFDANYIAYDKLDEIISSYFDMAVDSVASEIKKYSADGVNSKLVELSKEILNDFLENDTFGIIKEAVDYIKEANKQSYIDILEIYNKEDRNLKKFVSYCNTLEYQYLPDLVSSLKQIEKSALLELDIVNHNQKVKEIDLIPIGSKTSIACTKIIPYTLKANKDDLSKFDKISLSPKEMTLSITIGANGKSNILIHSFNDDINLFKNAIRNTSDKQIKINKNYAKEFDKIIFEDDIKDEKRRYVANDEADEKIGGELGNAITQLIKNNASMSVVATGTPASRASEPPKLLKLNGQIPLETVEASEVEFKKLYGVNEIQNEVLALVVANLSTSQELRATFEKYFNEYKKMSNREVANQETLLQEMTVAIVDVLNSNNILDDETLDYIDMKATTKVFEILINIMKAKAKTNKNIAFPLLVETSLMSSNSRELIKDISKISSIKSFATAFVGLIGAKGTSTTNAGAKKDVVFEDIEIVSRNFDKSKQGIDFDDFIEYNRGGVRAIQSVMQQYTRSTFLIEAYAFLSKNFESFMNNFNLKKGKNNISVLLEELKEKYPEDFENINESLLFTMFKATTTTSTNDMRGLYNKSLKRNANIDILFKDDDFSMQRKKVFIALLSVYKKFLQKLPEYDAQQKQYLEMKKQGDKKAQAPDFFIKLREDDENSAVFDFKGTSHTYKNMFENKINSVEVKEYILDNLNSYAIPENIIFSVKIDLCPKDFENLIIPDEDGYKIPYLFELTNREENILLDVIANKGFEKKIKKQMLQGANALNTNSRTFAQLIAILNTYKAYNDLKDSYLKGELQPSEAERFRTHFIENDGITLLVNQTSNKNDKFNFSEVLNRVKRSNDVNIIVTPRNKLEEMAKRLSVYDEKTVYLFANKDSISRGFDLSFFHKKAKNNGKGNDIVATLNFFDPESGSNTIQVLSRLDSPTTNKNIINLFNGGYDAKIKLFGEDGDNFTKYILQDAVDLFANGNTKVDILQKAFKEFLSADKEVENDVVKAIVDAMNLKVPFGISENTAGAIKAHTSVETYNMIMEGRYNLLNQEDKIRIYNKAEVLNTFKFKELITEEDKNEEQEHTIDADIDNQIDEYIKEELDTPSIETSKPIRRL